MGNALSAEVASRLFLSGNDAVAHAGGTTLRAAKHLDALNALRAAVVGDFQL